MLSPVLLTLLSDSVLAGLGAFGFSAIVITIFGEIVPQAYFSRHAFANGISAQTPAKCLRGVAFSSSKAHGSTSQLVARPRGNHTDSV
jgi:CBS domain containing-hemolysin-like protein